MSWPDWPLATDYCPPFCPASRSIAPVTFVTLPSRYLPPKIAKSESLLMGFTADGHRQVPEVQLKSKIGHISETTSGKARRRRFYDDASSSKSDVDRGGGDDRSGQLRSLQLRQRRQLWR